MNATICTNLSERTKNTIYWTEKYASQILRVIPHANEYSFHYLELYWDKFHKFAESF